MNRGVLHLLLCLLLAFLGTPASAHCRPETRVGGSLVFLPIFASQESANPIDTPLENGGCGYDFASGLHKYLYCQNNPVNHIDPSGHDDLGELVVNMGIQAGSFAMRLGPILAAQITGMSTIGRVGFIAAAAIMTAEYGYNEFAGNSPTQLQSQKLQTAINLIQGDGFGELANRARSLRFRVLTDLIDSKDAFGYTPFFAVMTVWLDQSIFSWDNEAFAAVIIHETEHTMTWLNHWRENPCYQVESDFLWTEGIAGNVDAVTRKLPQTDSWWIHVQADNFRRYQVNNPAITP